LALCLIVTSTSAQGRRSNSPELFVQARVNFEGTEDFGEMYGAYTYDTNGRMSSHTLGHNQGSGSFIYDLRDQLDTITYAGLYTDDFYCDHTGNVIAHDYSPYGTISVTQIMAMMASDV
jgi:hypothetical protein